MSLSNTPNYEIKRDDPSELFLRARNIAGLWLQSEFNKHKGDLPESCDYKWIKPELIYPSFDHLTFGYGNQVFSVLIELRDSHKSYLAEAELNRLLNATSENNLVPCLFSIMLPGLTPVAEGWNLTHAANGEKIIPNEVATDELIEMSEWELRNFAIQVVKNYIPDKLGGQVMSFCDVLQINPQLWFEDNDGNRCWVVVRHLRTPAEGELSKWVGLEKSNPRLRDYSGYFAGVSLVSSAPVLLDMEGNIISLSERFSGKAPLYRGDGFHVKFEGLQKIYTV